MYPGPGRLSGRARRLGRGAQPQGVGRQGRRSSRSTAACSPPAATSSSTARWTAGSRRSTREPAPSCGSSTSPPASSPIRSPISGPDGKQYVAVYSGIGGWMGAVAFPEHLRRRSVRRARRRRRDEGHQEIHGAGRHGVCLRSVRRVRCVAVAAVRRGRAQPAGARTAAGAAAAVCADPNNMPFSNRQRRGIREQDRRRSSRASWAGRSPISGRRSGAASSATR